MLMWSKRKDQDIIVVSMTVISNDIHIREFYFNC